jgi:hypothetical protein
MNGDGRDDVVSAGTLAIYLGNGAGGFVQSDGDDYSGQGVSPQVGDFNGDGKLDVAWIRDGLVFMRPGAGGGHLSDRGATWAAPVAMPHTGFDFATRLSAADFNPAMVVPTSRSPTPAQEWARIPAGSRCFWGGRTAR